MGFFIQKFENAKRNEMLRNITPNISTFALIATKNTLYQ